MTEIIVLAHNIRSAFNVGSVLRTSDGLGVNRVIFSGYTPYPEIENDPRLPHERARITSQIAKTALGAELTVPSEVSTNIEATIKDLRSSGFWVLALEQAENSIKLQNYSQIQPRRWQSATPPRIALLLGEEVNGISPELLRLADQILEIPMLGQKESFNVSVAFAIALWELRKQDFGGNREQ